MARRILRNSIGGISRGSGPQKCSKGVKEKKSEIRLGAARRETVTSMNGEIPEE